MVFTLKRTVVSIGTVRISGDGRSLSLQLPDRYASHKQQGLPYPLTHRELDVLELLFKGKSVTTTAQALQRDIRTVSAHKRNAMFKLELYSDSDLYRWAAQVSVAGTAVNGGQ